LNFLSKLDASWFTFAIDFLLETSFLEGTNREIGGLSVNFTRK